MSTTTDTPAGPQTEPQAPAQPGPEGTPEGTPEAKTDEAKPARAKAPDTSKITATGINAAALAVPDLLSASQPVRERSAEQKLMDVVAVKAYNAFVAAKRPSVWQKMPVITYILDDSEVAAYRYLIRRACAIVEPVKPSAGVRVRFGNEFTLSEEMAKKIGKPDAAGKTVLAWAAIDKREPTDESKKNPAVTAVTAKHDEQPKPDKPKSGR
jgi:hypothetical protein